MKVGIVEDEPIAADRLRELLSQIDSEIEVVCHLDSITSALKFLRSFTGHLDLLFMDIELADGVCFEIFDQFKIETPVIFTTAYNQYAIKAFSLNSIHYLLKPIKLRDLQAALSKYHRLNNIAVPDLVAIRELLQSAKKNYKTHFLGKFGNQLVHMSIQDISYFYTEDKLVYMVGKDKKKYLIDYSLEELGDQYLDPDQFFRVSRKFIVNINSVELLRKYYNQRLSLGLRIRQEHEIVVSREKVSEFKNWLTK